MMRQASIMIHGLRYFLFTVCAMAMTLPHAALSKKLQYWMRFTDEVT